MLVKIFTLSILLFLNPVTFVADRNYYTTEAEKAFRKQKYALASQYYGHVVYDLDSKKDDLLSNLAHAYFLDKKYTLAAKQYQIVAKSKNAFLASVALNQLGCLASMNQDFEKALQYFKEAIIRYTQNNEARYNCELMAKILYKYGKKIKKEKKNNTQEKQEDKLEKKQTKTENSKIETKLNPQKLKDLQFNKEKAEAILNTLRNQEMKYIQQQQQKKKRDPPQKNSLPDW